MRKIGKYEILGLLGRGGMSVVYKVRLPVVNKVVALKLLSPHPQLKDLMGEEEVQRLFINEAKLIAGLRHPQLVDIKDFDFADGIPYYVMEYYCNNLGLLIGETYQPEEPSRTISPDKALWYTSQTLEGLACLHQAEIVHRDIKPYNLLVTDEDLIKISDFGLSRLRGETFSGPPNLKVGSPFYAAPEQEIDPDLADGRSDLYAVGVMLYRMLTGRLPMAKRTPLTRFNPDLDGDWEAFLDRALALKKEDRFPNARGMIEALDHLTKAWEGKKAGVCSGWELESSFSTPSLQRTDAVRFQPVRIGPQEAQAFFRLDPYWRPLTYPGNDFMIQREGIIYDRASGLTWQQAGSEYPLTWEEGHRYLEHLNQKQFGGLSDWRLPTVDELCILLKPALRVEDSCLEPIFDQTQRSFWSSDRRSYVAAWFVNVELGFISWQDFSCYNVIRAVCASGK